MSTYPPDSITNVQLDPVTSRALAKFGQRRKVLLVLRAIAGAIVVFIAAMLIIALCDYFWILSDALRLSLSLAGYAATFAALWFFGIRDLRDNDSKSLAVHMQSAAPNLRDDVLSAVELADPEESNGSADFRQRLQGRVARRVAALDVGELLPMKLIRRWLTSGLVVTSVCLLLMLIPSMQFGRRFARAMLPGAPIERASKTQITILEPSPASGYVAQGDAVGVVVQISGEQADDVRLIWQSDDGMSGESVMSPRVLYAKATATLADAASNSMLPTGDVFAANLSVGTSPIDYQIRAGDGISLWNRLTPLPRPRVSLFSKRYVFPDYAKLSPREEKDEHGDLKALTGTTAEISVHFDEPVQEAKVRYANEGGEILMAAADDTKAVYTASIPIKTASQYQVDATSVKSGLTNPFSPSYTITPVIDMPPVTRWDESIPDMTIVSPLSVMDLAGSVQDDLPVDQIIQEFTVNSEPTQNFSLPISTPSRQSSPTWQWDLMKRLGDQKETTKLKGGDIIRTRLVSIDRRGQRSESRMIDLLIADDGFNADRHQELERYSELVKEVVAWTKSADVIGTTIKELGQSKQADKVEPLRQLYTELNSRTSPLIQSIAGELESADQPTTANSWEMLGRSIIALDGDIQFSINDLASVLDVQRDSWNKQQERLCRQISGDGTRISHQAGRIDTLARAIISHRLSLAIAHDVISLRNSLRPLTDENMGVPADRFGRYVTVTLGRMTAIDDLLDSYQDIVMDSTREHFKGEHWSRWAERWSILLERMKDDNPNEKGQRDLIKRFEGELEQKAATSMADGRLPQLFNDAFRDIRREMRSYANLLDEIRLAGYEAVREIEKSQKEDDANKAALSNLDAQQAGNRYSNRIAQTVTRLTAESDLHRRRQRVDLQYAADLGLLRRAIENVNQDGFVPYRDEPANEVHEHLAGAIRILESVHESQLGQMELEQLLESEQAIDDSPDSRLSSSIWIYRYSLSGEWPVKQWQEAKLDWDEIIEPIDKTRYDQDYSAARDRISRRRWDQKEPVSAEVPLTRLTERLRTGLKKLEPKVKEARETIQRYVLTLPEQARKAAEAAREAEQRTEKREDSQSETAKQLAEDQKEAESAAEQTVQSLIDMANTSDMLDDEQREISRDADAAATAIKDATDQAEEAMEKAQDAASEQQRDEALEKVEASLEHLAETLEKTAEHFEKLKNGENVDQSRQELRQAEEELQIANDLEQRYEQAEAMAEAAKSDPRELLKKLEEELKKNEPMQEELSEISENAAKSAQNTLEQAQNDERELNQSLERSDPVVQEAKRRTAMKLEELTRRMDSVNNHMLETAQEAAGWANEAQTRDKLNQARKEIQEAAEKARQMGGENALASEIEQMANDVGEAIKKANKEIAQSQEEAKKASERDIHKDEPARKNTQNLMEAKQRTMRSRLAQDLNRERSQWSRQENEARRRIQEAQRQERDAKNNRQRAEDQLKKAEQKKAGENEIESLKKQVQQHKEREAAAENAEKAADETRRFAEQQRKNVEQATKDLQKQKQEPLTRPNPAGQLAEDTAKKAAQSLSEVGKELDQIAKAINEQPDLQAPTDQASNLAQQQDRINRDVDNAAEQVARAARHEERLGQQAAAEKLDAAAKSIEENGLKAGEEAKQSLEQAADESKNSQQAADQVAKAQNSIAEEAKKLADMLQQQSAQPTGDQQREQQGDQANQPSSPQNQASQTSNESQQKAKQMAQTLDELDRAIAESEKQAQQSGEEQSGQQPPSEQQAGQQQPGGQQPGGQQPGEKSPAQKSAAESSPTLSQMLDSQAQQAAKDRQQQLQPGKNSQSSKQQGEAEPGTKEGDALTQNSGPGDPPGGEGALGQVPGSDDLGQWGLLRERKTDDASEAAESRVAPQYRREVEAYFRAIARRAAAKSPANSASKENSK
ncbi:MAG: hypothetical protein WBD20_02270 [Pirellulaceae bacterium]